MYALKAEVLDYLEELNKEKAVSAATDDAARLTDLTIQGA